MRTPSSGKPAGPSGDGVAGPRVVEGGGSADEAASTGFAGAVKEPAHAVVADAAGGAVDGAGDHAYPGKGRPGMRTSLPCASTASSHEPRSAGVLASNSCRGVMITPNGTFEVRLNSRNSAMV